ncbi:E3 ubiquitin-protein ligase ZSWIM2 isoform X1 [Triplophysa rosa]|uniref:E3 ubiquitin-protein ligase ZSWIM2 isoform X1 n=2 Tax=Triplophysa rosa TaxID=992332 RepID=UPI002545F096|nr:E3 ubiquitin-protein ligase ZSWIM2 isoform X1 [Triplophysa rosa]
MFRKTAWRKCVSDVTHSHQDRALNTTILILREVGPVGFLLQEDGDSKQYKVCLGDPHTCTCPTFQKEKDLCQHICWILMRKFRLPRDHEYCFQYGLAERQILDLLQGLHVTKTTSHSDRPSCPEPDEDDGRVRQKAIEKDDLCPVCQEELLLKKLPVTYCRYVSFIADVNEDYSEIFHQTVPMTSVSVLLLFRFGCGNNIHISCMKVWADHQTKLNSRMLKCPLCRDDFGTLTQLKEEVRNSADVCTYYERECLDKHLGVVCNGCGVCPVVGKCFKCTECSYFHLCEKCFRRHAHPQHSFTCRTSLTERKRVFVQKRGHSWQAVSEETRMMDKHTMDRSVSAVTCDVVPNHVMKSLPMVRVRKESKLLHPGVQCRICLSRFQTAQNVRSLPCKHKFHTDCIDALIQKSNCCPLDFHVIYNPLTWNIRVGRTQSSPAPPGVTRSKRTDPHISEFILPCIGLQVQKGHASSVLRPGTRVSGCEGPSSVKSLSQGLQDLYIHSSHIEPFSRKTVMKHGHIKPPNKGLSSAAAERRANPAATFSIKQHTEQRRLDVTHTEPTSTATPSDETTESRCSPQIPHQRRNESGHKGHLH